MWLVTSARHEFKARGGVPPSADRESGLSALPVLRRFSRSGASSTELELPLTERQLASYFGVHGSTIRRWKSQKPEFCAAVERGRLLFDMEVAERLYERATGTYQWVEEQAVVCKNIVYDDNGNKLRETERVEVIKVVKRLPPDFSAQQFWLKNHQREYWSEKQRRLREEESKSQENRLAALRSLLPRLP